MVAADVAIYNGLIGSDDGGTLAVLKARHQTQPMSAGEIDAFSAGRC